MQNNSVIVIYCQTHDSFLSQMLVICHHYPNVTSDIGQCVKSWSIIALNYGKQP